MSEIVNDIQHDVAAQVKATKSTKKAPKAAAKASPNGKAKAGVSPQRAQLIKAMQKRGGTLAMLVERSKLPERAAYHHLWHMRKDGLVKSHDVDVDGKKELHFDLTAKGQKVKV